MIVFVVWGNYTHHILCNTIIKHRIQLFIANKPIFPYDERLTISYSFPGFPNPTIIFINPPALSHDTHYIFHSFLHFYLSLLFLLLLLYYNLVFSSRSNRSYSSPHFIWDRTKSIFVLWIFKQ